MPAVATNDDGGVVGGEFLFDNGLGLAVDGFFDLLALAVLLGEGLGENFRAGVIIGEEELEGLLRAGEAAGGVDARAELEADIGGRERRTDAGGVDECAHAGPARFFQLQQAALDEDAVLTLERDDIGDGAESDDVEVIAQIDLGRGPGFE